MTGNLPDREALEQALHEAYRVSPHDTLTFDEIVDAVLDYLRTTAPPTPGDDPLIGYFGDTPIHASNACVFCRKIADGSVDPTPDDAVVSFIPLNPVTPGHRLFVPRAHVQQAAERPDITGRVFAQAAAWGQGQDNAGERRGFNLITSAGEVATQSVKHLHVHYVQRRPDDGLHLPWTGQHAAPAAPGQPETADRPAQEHVCTPHCRPDAHYTTSPPPTPATDGLRERIEALRAEWASGHEPVHHRGYIAGLDRALAATGQPETGDDRG